MLVDVFQSLLHGQREVDEGAKVLRAPLVGPRVLMRWVQTGSGHVRRRGADGFYFFDGTEALLVQQTVKVNWNIFEKIMQGCNEIVLNSCFDFVE